MATRQASSGLTIGQVFTLSFGFILASVLIFALGWWVGYDAAQQRRERDRQPVRVPVVPPPMPALVATAIPPAAAVPPTAAMTSKPAPATPTGTPEISIRTMPPSRTPTRAAEPAAHAGTWSVQVKATTEALEAVMFARQLRQKGYDAYTVQAPIGNVTWYRVRVGRFADRATARATEQRLKQQEKIEAAYVVNE
jgi:cell division septation protein DedD